VSISLDVWRVPRSGVPRAFWSMAVDRGRMRRAPGVSFVKLLGTGRGRDFRIGAADLTRWAALIVTDDAAADTARDRAPGDAAVPQPGLARVALGHCRITMAPIARRGTWAGREPFDDEIWADPKEKGLTLVLTRARLRPVRAAGFWRAIEPVSAALRGQEGVLAAFGFGEAPVGYQGTVSIWRDPADIVRFAYRQPEHAAVVASTPHQRWYAEELFARFRVLDVTGDREVIGWKDSA
jgi:hypothetical protein